jgi:hypothetical protein
MKGQTKTCITVAMLLAGALAAKAQTFGFQSFGATWTHTGIGPGATYLVNETIPNQSLFLSYHGFLSSSNTVTSLNYSLTLGGAGTVSGSGSFMTSKMGEVTFDFVGLYSRGPQAQIAISDASTTYILSSGPHLSGHFSNDLFTVGRTDYEYNTLSGVPETTPVAGLGLGAFGMLLLRRRK